MAVADFNRTMIDAMEGLAGRHAGYRRAHARGVILEGLSCPVERRSRSRRRRTSGMTVFRRSSGSRTPAVIRVRQTARRPSVVWRSSSSRLTAARRISAVNVPAFVASTPPKFLELVKRLTDAPAGPERQATVSAFVTAHPESMRAFKFVGEIAVPVSYGTTRYWATHSFVWIDETGRRRFVRYTWEPVEGEQVVSTSQGRGFSPTHHTEELLERLKGGAVSFTLRVQFALPGDPITDSTQLWPDDREQINVGTPEITGLAAHEQHWDATTFDPTRTGDGIEPSGDPVLLARGALYDESLRRRTQETGGNHGLPSGTGSGALVNATPTSHLFTHRCTSRTTILLLPA
jgi:catalase